MLWIRLCDARVMDRTMIGREAVGGIFNAYYGRKGPGEYDQDYLQSTLG